MAVTKARTSTRLNMPQELTDDSPMPFGKYGPHKGDPKKMKDVPAQWLHWYWTNGGEKKTKTCGVAAYIEKNIRALAKEYTDGIW